MNITPATALYAVLGHPIRHSLSPVMHNAAFTALGLDAVYLALEVPPERLMTVLPVLAETGFAGFNLTVPLKEVAARGLTEIDAAARRLGSVNTVQVTPGGLKGYSTDGAGFLRAVQEAWNLSLNGRSVCILGCGGAGRAVAIACSLAGARRLGLADVDPERVRKLAADLAALPHPPQVESPGADNAARAAACREADLVIQATPVGLQAGDPSPLGPEAFRPGQWVYDLVYVFPETALMATARRQGAHAANGLDMLLWQGALSFTIWTGREAPVDIMRQALEVAVYDGKPGNNPR